MANKLSKLKLGVIGMSEGNGHPYSWSAIFNGFDREEMKGLEKFDYEFFLNDIFQYCDRIFWKTNYQNLKSKKLFPESVQPFLWWPMKRLEDNQRLFSMDKPYRAWYIVLTKEQWENR